MCFVLCVLLIRQITQEPWNLRKTDMSELADELVNYPKQIRSLTASLNWLSGEHLHLRSKRRAEREEMEKEKENLEIRDSFISTISFRNVTDRL